MFGIADYGAFVIAIIVFLLIPGPGNLALITSTSKGGIRGGLAATGGLMVGDQVLIWMSVAGIAALLAAYPTAFHVVQWLGAGYLAWLGLRMLFTNVATIAMPVGFGFLAAATTSAAPMWLMAAALLLALGPARRLRR